MKLEYKLLDNKYENIKPIVWVSKQLKTKQNKTKANKSAFMFLS